MAVLMPDDEEGAGSFFALSCARKCFFSAEPESKAALQVLHGYAGIDAAGADCGEI